MELEVPDGVQSFNLWTIWIMARLWEEHPQPQFFMYEPGGVYVTGDPAVAGAMFGPNDRPSLRKFRPTMEWLLSERYITGKANGAGHFALVALTEKGFSVLKQIPRSVAAQSAAQSKPLGALMREAVISHGVGAAATALSKAMIGT
jgi:hypothetical protein